LAGLAVRARATLRPWLTGDRDDWRLAHHLSGNQNLAQPTCGGGALAQSLQAHCASSDRGLLNSEHRVAALAALGFAFFGFGVFPSGIRRARRELECAEVDRAFLVALLRADHCLWRFAMWDGDVPESTRPPGGRSCRAFNPTLGWPYWQLWGRCFEVVLVRRHGGDESRTSGACGIRCGSPTHQEKSGPHGGTEETGDPKGQCAKPEERSWRLGCSRAPGAQGRSPS